MKLTNFNIHYNNLKGLMKHTLTFISSFPNFYLKDQLWGNKVPSQNFFSFFFSNAPCPVMYPKPGTAS